MIGKKMPEKKISTDEALKLFAYASTEEMHIAMDLYRAYRENKGKDPDALWDLMSLLSFVYDTGRVQGIREERSKKLTA